MMIAVFLEITFELESPLHDCADMVTQDFQNDSHDNEGKTFA